MRLEHSQGKQVPIERLFFEFLREATTTAMRLPQEVYDLIIDHLHNDRLSLRYCALVSRRWVYRSHAHFFYFLILGNKLFRRWLDAFSPSDNHIHSAVKVLILHPSLDSFEDFMRFAEYAPAFRNLEHLLINGRGLPYESQRSTCIRPFGHLGNNLKTLQLEYLDVNPRIIARFPRLEFLIMESPRLPSVGAEEGDDIPAESDIRGAFKGSIEFDIHPWEPGSGPFVAALTDCPLGYDTIKVDLGTVNGEGTARVLSHLVSRCSNTLEVLHVNSGSEQLYAGLNLSPLMHLREISLILATDRSFNASLPRFSTITSGTMSKITIIAQRGSHAEELYNLFGREYGWSKTDEDLFRLAEFQAGSNPRRVEFVVDLRQVNLEPQNPSGRERMSFGRNWWIQRTSRYALPKFSQLGTINFILPSSRVRSNET